MVRRCIVEEYIPAFLPSVWVTTTVFLSGDALHFSSDPAGMAPRLPHKSSISKNRKLHIEIHRSIRHHLYKFLFPDVFRFQTGPGDIPEGNYPPEDDCTAYQRLPELSPLQFCNGRRCCYLHPFFHIPDRLDHMNRVDPVLESQCFWIMYWVPSGVSYTLRISILLICSRKSLRGKTTDSDPRLPPDDQIITGVPP